MAFLFLTVFFFYIRYNLEQPQQINLYGGYRLKTVIYLDVLLLMNFLIAYLLIQIVSLLCSVPLSFFRAAIGAMIAACSTLILLAPELPSPILLIFKIFIALLVVFSSFGFCGWRPFLRQTVWFFLMNIALAGFVLLAVLKSSSTGMHMNNLTVYINVSPILLLSCTLSTYGCLRLVLFLFGTPEPKEYWQLKCNLNGTDFPEITALYDTGFLMQDPLGNHPAILVSYPFVGSFLPNHLSCFLQAFFKGKSEDPPPGASIRMIPCKTVTGCRILPAISGASIEIIQNKTVHRINNAVLVFSQEIFTDGSVQALFGKHLLQSAEKERSIPICTK